MIFFFSHFVLLKLVLACVDLEIEFVFHFHGYFCIDSAALKRL